VTEIPEHLLKRSKERRAAMGLGGGETPGDAVVAGAGAGEAASDPSSMEKPAVAPAAARSAAPVPATAPPPPPPDPPYVAAAKSRKKVPMWAAPVLAVLPLWGFIYYQSMQKPPAGANDPLALGQQVYDVKGGCVGCHGSDGTGGVGAKLKDGEVLKTFKNPLAMVHWLAFGAAGGARANGTYGDLDRPGGPHNTAALPSAMPAQKDNLTAEEIAAVTMYVRQKLSGGKPDKGFDVADFPTLGDVVTKVIALGPGGDPKVPGGSSSKAATTKVAGKNTSGSSTGSAGGSSGAGSTGGTNKKGNSSGSGTGSSGTGSGTGSGGTGGGGGGGGG
jgi:mono/diheme cytochrome c family protein